MKKVQLCTRGESTRAVAEGIRERNETERLEQRLSDFQRAGGTAGDKRVAQKDWLRRRVQFWSQMHRSIADAIRGRWPR